MAPINISAITFIPGMEFTFGSFNFIAGVDRRLHVSNLEATLISQINPDPADHIFIRPVSKPDSDRLRDDLVRPKYLFGFRNSANTFQRMLSQIMEDKPEHATGKLGRVTSLGRVVGVIRPTFDECRAVNVIISPLGLPDLGEDSLHRVINSPTRSDSSNGSWDPVRRLYAIVGGGEAPTESDLKAQQDDEIRQQAAEIAAAEAERLRQEEANHWNLVSRGPRVHEEILQTKMGDQNIFITPQQNILIAKALFDTVKPMMAEDHAATRILTRIKVMVTAEAIRHHEEGNRAPSVSRPASSR